MSSIGRLPTHITTSGYSSSSSLGIVRSAKSWKIKDAIVYSSHAVANDNGRFNCPYCLEWFYSRDELKDHVMRHPKRYECNFCFMTLKDRTALVRHETQRHLGFGSNLPPPPAPVCNGSGNQLPVMPWKSTKSNGQV
ncbi:unnamed protein product [Somion occarium]|uniref:C2H2-type domain-containing protein n=1 Tax=Somion occarium TaxID=3059160 RepID=A0ABP1DSS5_9APHY